MRMNFSAHRFRSFHDFGFVSLDILHVYAEDSGTYTCVARNDLGEAQTSTQIHCERKLFVKYTIISGFGRRLLFANIVLRTSLLAIFIPCTHKFLSCSAPFLFLCEIILTLKQNTPLHPSPSPREHEHFHGEKFIQLLLDKLYFRFY